MDECRKNKPEDFTPCMRRLRARQDFREEPDGGTITNGFRTPYQRSFDTPEMRGSIQWIFSENIGEYVVVEFLIGTEMIVRKQGMLYNVGVSFVALYDEAENQFIVCDLFSIKFVYFYPSDAQRPRGNYNRLPPPPTGRM